MASIWVGHRGTIKDYPSFSPSVDAEAIRKAIRGIGTDEERLISILTERSNVQRQLIVKEYQAAYEKELKDDLKGDLSGHFQHLMVALVTPPAVFDAKQLKKSMKGTGTDEDALIELLTTRTSRQMKEVSQAYYTIYKKSLGDAISSETSGDFRKALLTLADGRRDESLKVDEHLAKKDAQILYNAGENKWGTDEDKFTEILCLRSFPQLKLTFDEYRNISQKDIEESIKGELSGHFEDLLLAIVHCVRNTPAFLAGRLHRSLKGAGTDEFTLNRIMVSRSEIDLLDIRYEFKKHYGYSLYSAIKRSMGIQSFTQVRSKEVLSLRCSASHWISTSHPYEEQNGAQYCGCCDITIGSCGTFEPVDRSIHFLIVSTIQIGDATSS